MARGRPGIDAAGSRRLLMVLLALLLIAAALRLVWLDRYPIGWHHDEALMGVMAGEVFRGENRPIFFEQYLGQEPLYIYLSAGMMALLGDEGVLPLRLTSALVGLLTVLLTYALGRALFNPRVGLLAMALVGTSFWQVMSSRMAYRSITQPPVEALAILCFWRARQQASRWWFALAGAALGGSLYTYLGARAFPGVFVGFGLWLAVTGRRPTRHDLVRIGLLGAVALVVAAPLAGYFLTHPGTFSARLEQVSIFQPAISHGQPWAMLLENAIKLLRSFTFGGEPMWRYNIPGRPMFVGTAVVAFYLGLAVVLHRLLWHRGDAAALLLIWIAVMLFPSLLSWDVGAYTLRAMGLVPAIYLVPALGYEQLWQSLGRRWAWGRLVAGAGLVVVVIGQTVWTARDYFVVWAPSFGASMEGHADAVAQARFLVNQAKPDRQEIWVASEYYHHPVLAQLARPVYPFLRWFDGRQSVVFSPGSARPALYVLAFNGMTDEAGQLFPTNALVGAEYFRQGVDGGAPPPLFQAYRLTPEQVRAQVERLLADPRLQPVDGKVPGFFTPLGVRLGGPVKPGDDLVVIVIWRVDQKPPPGDYQLAVSLVDHAWQELGGDDALGYPTAEWRPGDIVWSRFVVHVPKTAAPGQDLVQLALYDRRTGQRVPTTGGVPGARALTLGHVRVVSSEQPRQPERLIGARLSAPAGATIELVGVDLASQPATETLKITIHWRADRTLKQDYTVFVQLLDESGRVIAQSDSWPAAGALPTSAWLPGEIVLDEHQLQLPRALPPARYRLIAGLYALTTGRRLPVVGGGDAIDLARLPLPTQH